MEVVQKNFNSIDLVKVIGSICVLYGHTEPIKTIAPELNFYIYNVLIRFVIPFFFIVSGYLYYGKYLSNQSRTKTISDYGRKYLKRIIVLYFVWSLVYFPYMFCELSLQSTSNVKLFLNCVREVFYSGTLYHMWYFTALVFAIVVVDIWVSRFRLKSLLFLSFALYLVGLLGETYYGLIPAGSFLSSAFEVYFKIFVTTRNGLFFGLLFVILGAYLYEKPLKLSVNLSVLFLIISYCLLFLEVSLLNKFLQPRDYNFMIFSVPLALFLFNWLINLKLSWKLDYISLRKLSTLIYCSHVTFIIIFTEVFKYLEFDALAENGLIIFSLVLLSSLLFSSWVIKLEDHKLVGFVAKRLA